MSAPTSREIFQRGQQIAQCLDGLIVADCLTAMAVATGMVLTTSGATEEQAESAMVDFVTAAMTFPLLPWNRDKPPAEPETRH